MKRKIPTLPLLFCAVSLSSCWTDLCPNRDFVIANPTDNDIVACIDWEIMEDENIGHTLIKIDSNGVSVNNSELDTCSIKHAYACDFELTSKWGTMDEDSRKEWCKKLKCVDCKSKSCWGDYGPMKYNGTACVCDY